MSRSPLAYPLNRAADTDVGGAADLQTDVMRFMAILALCLVAIFALVQSIPLTPIEPATPGDEPAETPTNAAAAPINAAAGTTNAAAKQEKTIDETVVLTRPKRVPESKSARAPSPQEAAATAASARPPSDPNPVATDAAPAEPVAAPVEDEGFTLRFASDAALMRSVAAHHVGVYAIDSGRARRMTVSESRLSFWDASMPNTFHEMETTTVPAAVVDALERSGAATGRVQWGVTLPGRMTAQLDALMQEHRGGDLIIGAGGNITWEASR